ncbi:hypothetical protein CRYUN_Cryun01aG0054500 [Craigia yunnanensis]
MDQRSSNLLDEALGLDQTIEPWPLRRRLVAIEDRVETSGSFVLHHLLKRSLSPNSSNVSIFIAFSQPYSLYDRVLRKLDCSLITLNHEDIYSNADGRTFLLQIEYLADILIKAEPLATGLATDVHGQFDGFEQGYELWARELKEQDK